MRTSSNRIAHAVPTVAVLLCAATAAHALVAPPSAAPHRNPVRRATPAPRGDPTVLRSVDAAQVLGDLWRTDPELWTPWEQARAVKRRDRRDYFDFVVDHVEPTAPCAAPSAAPSAGFSPTSMLSSVASLRELAKTVKKHDRQQYFDFVVDQVETTAPPLRRQPHDFVVDHVAARPAPDAAPASAAPSAAALLAALPSSVSSLWAQARTVAEDDRRLYFDLVRRQAQDDPAVDGK